MKKNYKISSSVSSINNPKANQQQTIRIDLRSPSNKLIIPYNDSKVERSFSETESTNDTKTSHCQRRQSSHFIEYVKLNNFVF
jgi:hypothetical protein